MWLNSPYRCCTVHCSWIDDSGESSKASLKILLPSVTLVSWCSLYCLSDSVLKFCPFFHGCLAMIASRSAQLWKKIPWGRLFMFSVVRNYRLILDQLSAQFPKAFWPCVMDSCNMRLLTVLFIFAIFVSSFKPAYTLGPFCSP